MAGTYIVVEGPDGSGKGVFMTAAKTWADNQGKKVFDLKPYWKEHRRHPEPEELEGFDVLLSYEPTFVWAGAALRDEMMQKGNRTYTGKSILDALSTDRLALMNRVIIPALERNMAVFSDRSMASTLVYQPIMDETVTIEDILEAPGHERFLERAPDHMVIMLVDGEHAMKRLGKRMDKQDNHVFEEGSLINQHNHRYQSDWFQGIFGPRGTTLHYIDTTPLTIEQSQETVSTLIQTIV